MEGLKFRCLDTYVVRYPAEQAGRFEHVARLDAGLTQGNGHQPDDDEREEQRELRALAVQLGTPQLRSALRLGSPDLALRLEASPPRWGTEAAQSRAHSGLEEALVVYDYANRVSTRATPFGINSVVSLGTLGRPGSFAGIPWGQWRRVVRGDHLWLVKVQKQVLRQPTIRGRLRYELSSSAWEHDDYLRFVTTRAEASGLCYFGARIGIKAPLRSLLAHYAQSGSEPQAYVALRDMLTSRHQAGVEAVGNFLDSLISMGVLVSELEPPVTGPDALDHMLDILDRFAPDCEARRQLARLKNACAAIQNASEADLPASIDALLSVADESRDADSPPRKQVPIQIDCIADHVEPVAHLSTKASAPAHVPRSVAQDVLRTVSLLGELGFVGKTSPDLLEFRRAFAARYEGASVPFLQVVDSEVGIGTGHHARHPAAATDKLLAGLPFPAFPGSGHRAEDDGEPSRQAEAQVPDAIVAALGLCLRNRHHELVIDRKDPVFSEYLASRAKASDRVASLPASWSAMVTLLASDSEALGRGAYEVLLHSAAGPGSARLLGRFSHGSALMQAFVEEQLRAEEASDPSASFAEIVHVSQPRHGNVSKRPAFGRLELCVYSRSGAPYRDQVAIRDVDLKLTGGQLTLWSRPHGLRLVPRLTSAHNYSSPDNDIAYRMLCLLQNQAGRLPGWDWGSLRSMPFLPRVRAGRVILAPARWRLSGTHAQRLNTLRPESASVGDITRFVARLRDELGVPRYVRVGKWDQLLSFDLESPLARRAFIRTLKRGSNRIIREQLATPDQRPFQVAGAAHHHELVLSYVRENERHTSEHLGVTRQERPSLPFTAPGRLVPPGGAWLYLRVYLGMSDADRLIGTQLPPLLENARNEGLLQSWFFLRYTDPHTHLRIRFEAPNPAAQSDLRQRILAALTPWIEREVSWRVEEGTYAREFERYGAAKGMPLAEALFHHDSAAIAGLIGTGIEEEGRAAWSLATLSFVYAALLPDLAERRAAIKGVRGAFEREHCGSNGDSVRAMRQAIGKRFREHEPRLACLAAKPWTAGGEDFTSDALREILPSDLADEAVARFGGWARAAAPLLQAYLRDMESGEIPLTPSALASSLCHMHVNRMMRHFQRQTEYVLYEFLDRLTAREASRAAAPAQRSE